MEYNAAVQIWSERTQQEKGDNLTEGYVSELWNFTRISMTQNNLQELKKVDLVPTVEEYTTLLRCPRIQAEKAYSRAASDLILVHPDTKKRVEVFALSIFRSLGVCRRVGERRFNGCTQLLLAWFHSHFRKGLQEEDVEWRASWMIPDEILYQCGDFDWVPLLGILGAIGYAPLLVLR
ncbi:hypothetical protein Goari_020490 [Gossypium aridum]|uniref:DUF7745 domain-containing protein n=1 Tax=Gossypium aridum TaxID=34290 RepID=A0A7J8YSU9_GOSAI|nr:hypothetical protein [Gossypium aridum]